MQAVTTLTYITFGIALFIAIYFLYRALSRSNQFLTLISIWIIVQSIIATTGFYTHSHSLPPRFLALILPPIVLIILLFISPKGKRIITNLEPRFLTLVHTARIPVELVLYWLYLAKYVPQLMTFTGRNFDIIAGIFACILYFSGFFNFRLTKTGHLIWNIVGLALLFNIVILAVLSAPTPFQQFGFTQPNIAVLHFPYVLLPAVIVPIVLFAHCASIWQLCNDLK